MEFEKVWQMRWRNHWIVVRSCWNHRLQCSQQILVDDQVLDEEKGSGRTNFRELGGEVRTGGSVYSVRARLGETLKGRLACQIFVNDELVGGDVGEGIVSTLMPIAGVYTIAGFDIAGIAGFFKYTNPYVVLLLLPSAAGLLLYDRGSEGPSGGKTFDTWMLWFVLPFIVGCYFYGKHAGWWSKIPKRTLIPKWFILGFLTTLFAVVAAVFLVVILLGYLHVINANVGPQQEVVVDGKVIKKELERAKHVNSYKLIVRARDGHVYDLHVSERMFTGTKVGDAYRKSWYVGSLGIFYRRRIPYLED